MTLAPRLKAMGAARYANDGNPLTSGPGFDLTLHEDLVAAPKHWKKPSMIFVNSMSDLFHARVPLEFIQRVFKTMEETPQHTYQVLTKRSSRLPKLVDKLDWPGNLWMGVSVEDEEHLYRAEDLMVVPTVVRFLSAEPLLEGLPGLEARLSTGELDWVIVGGESGPNHRPFKEEWAVDIRDACGRQDVAFFFKQHGGKTSKAGGNLLQGKVVEEYPTPKLERLREKEAAEG